MKTIAMSNSFKISAIAILFTAFASCTKQDLGGLNQFSDIRPVNPITVQNAVDYRPGPTVTVSKSGTGAFSIILALPATSARSIKEITSVAISTSYTAIEGTTGLYNTAPIPGSGKTATFNTSLTEYQAKGGKLPPATNAELTSQFYFLVTLDDGSTVLTTPVRVLYLD